MPLREKSPGEGTVLDPFQISPLAFFASISPVTRFSFYRFPSQPTLQPIASYFSHAVTCQSPLNTLIGLGSGPFTVHDLNLAFFAPLLFRRHFSP